MNGKNFTALGIGELGRDFLNQLQEEEYNISGIKYIAIDFDEEILNSCKADSKIVLDKNSDITETNRVFTDILTGINVLFLFVSTENEAEMRAGLALTERAKSINILTIATILSHFGYDDIKCTAKIRKFKTAANALMILSFCETEKNDFKGLFYRGLCDRICWAVKSIADLMQSSREKFTEAKNFLNKIGTIEESSTVGGKYSAISKTAVNAIYAIEGYQYGPVSIHSIPALEYFYDAGPLTKYSFREATRVLIIIYANKRTKSLSKAINVIKENANPDAKIIWGFVFDNNLKDNETRITLISAFGFDAPSGIYYETYEEMFKNESLESLYNLLKDGKISFNTKDKAFGITFFEAAVRYGNAELVELCFERGAMLKDFIEEDDARFVTPSDPLGAAIEYDNLETLRVIIKHGIIKRDYKGRNALIIAVDLEKANIVRALIDDGMSVNECDYEGRTALIHASERANSEIVKMLVEAKANVNVKDNDGETALMRVARWCWSERHDKFEVAMTAKILINSGADINSLNKEGQNALMRILDESHDNIDEKIIKLLVDTGINVNAVDNNGNTALAIAIKNKFEVVPLLLSFGADMKLLKVRPVPSKYEHDEELQKDDDAVATGKFSYDVRDLIKSIIESTDDVNIMDINEVQRIFGVGRHDRIRLHLAINLYDTIKKAFIPYEFKPYPEANAILLTAAYCGNIRHIEKCLAKGADINTKTDDYYTPLMYAAMFNTAEVVRFLIEHGADVNAQNFQRQTALLLIISQNSWPWHPDVISELAKGGANVNEIFDGGLTLLMLAARDCHYYSDGDIAAELIEAGANINFMNKDGKTALMLAYEEKNFGTVRALLAAGADIKQILK